VFNVFLNQFSRDFDDYIAELDRDEMDNAYTESKKFGKKFKESSNDMNVDFQVGDRVIIPARCFPKGLARQQLGKKRNTAQRGTVDEITDDRVIFQLDNGMTTFFPLYSWEIKQIEKINESTKKFGKKFRESLGDVSTDPAYVCPYCGGRNCEFDDADDSPLEGYFDGGTLTALFYCDDCDKFYNVDYELKVKDVYPNEEENLEIELPGSELEDDDL
jgi:hypothetical protein